MSKLKRKTGLSDSQIQELLKSTMDDPGEDRLFSPEEEHQKKIRHRLTAAAAVLAVAVIAATVFFSLKDDSQSKKNEISTVEETQSQPAATVQETNALLDDQYPEITELIELYYKAKLTGDTNAIEKYVDNIEDVNMDEIKASNEYIKRYDNIECYTKNGLYDNTYVVYAYYEIKFKNITEMAPGIDVFYVIRDTDIGSVYIHNGATANVDIKNYIDALSQDADVKALFDKTNKALQTALSKDQNLKNLYQKMQKKTKKAGRKS